jgi:hypothetical protein
MLREAEMWRQADQARRRIVELKNECDIFISKVEDQIKDMERDYKSLEGTDRFGEYLEKNPNDKAVIDFYNSYVNGELRYLREQANIVRRDRSMNPQEKRNTIRLIVEQQNRIKSAFVNAVKGYNVEP